MKGRLTQNPRVSYRHTERDEYGNADVKGVDMSKLLCLDYEELNLMTAALNQLADYEDKAGVE